MISSIPEVLLSLDRFSKMQSFAAFQDFAAASQAVIEFLHNEIGFDLWMVTRTEGDDWIVLQAQDHGYGVQSGDVFRWMDSFCCQMVQGKGPCFAPKSEEIPAYASAPIGRKVPIGAYIGIPLNDADGELFGTLCAIHPTPLDDCLRHNMALVEILGRLLCTVLVSDMKLSVHSRQHEFSELKGLIDTETGTLSLEAWQRVIAAEEKRCLKFGHPTQVLCFHQEDESNGNLAKIVDIVQQNLTQPSSIARVGKREIAVLLPECNSAESEKVSNRLRQQLAQAKLHFKIGRASRDPRQGLEHALTAALLQCCPP